MNRIKKISSTVLMLSASLFLVACQPPVKQSTTAEFKNAQGLYAKQDYEHALEKLQAAANQGDANSQYALGYMYYYGKGTPVNTVLAEKWFSMAAEQGQPAAKKALNMLAELQSPMGKG